MTLASDGTLQREQRPRKTHALRRFGARSPPRPAPEIAAMPQRGPSRLSTAR